jgi:zinc transport system ATP-binding protein
MPEPIITFEDVSFDYPDRRVLQNVNFKVMAGNYVGIIGPNGGGKTTLLRLILGFLTPSSGVIKVFGQSPQISSQKVGYVPQVLRFDKQFPISVLELVLSGRLSRLPWYGRYSKTDYQAAHTVLEQVGLLDFQHHLFGTLSGGQVQRALIARALVDDPQLLLLDEPTASVDVQAEADIYAILHGLRDKMSIMMVTHDLQTAINEVREVLCVQGTVLPLQPEQVCQHFTVGLYHQPLITR